MGEDRLLQRGRGPLQWLGDRPTRNFLRIGCGHEVPAATRPDPSDPLARLAPVRNPAAPLLALLLVSTGAAVSVAAAAADGSAGSAPLRSSPSGYRYASPHGTATASCAKSNPCSIVAAVNRAAGGSTVIVTPGTYKKVSTPLVLHGNDITVRGASPRPRIALPRIETDASDGIYLSGDSALKNLEVDASDKTPNAGQAGVVALGATTVSHVIVRATGKSEIGCVADGTLTDSLCTASGRTGIAVSVSTAVVASSLDVNLYGVTAEAPGVAGDGLSVLGNNGTPVKVAAVNVIAHGGHADVVASSDASGGGEPVEVDLRDSDYKTTDKRPGTAVPTVDHHASDIKATPRFVAASRGNYHERAGSPTVNAGTRSGGSGVDLAGLPRTVGSSTDIGAYEFARPPRLTRFRIAGRTEHRVTCAVRVRPDGFTTDVRLLATHRTKRAISRRVRVVGARHAKTLLLELTGLRSHTKYRVHAVATSNAGIIASRPHSFTTT
jgi:hypothetical protein